MTKTYLKQSEIMQDQLNYWKEKNPRVYDNIYTSLRERGALTETGRIKKTLTNEQFKRHKNFFKQHWDTYSKYKKRLEEEAEEFNEENDEDLTADEYEELYGEYSDLIGELFDKFPSDEAEEEYKYLQTLDIRTAISRLRREIKNGVIEYAEGYFEKYGEESPF